MERNLVAIWKDHYRHQEVFENFSLNAKSNELSDNDLNELWELLHDAGIDKGVSARIALLELLIETIETVSPDVTVSTLLELDTDVIFDTLNIWKMAVWTS